jgi:serine/threonine protein phosphatase PrpC
MEDQYIALSMDDHGLPGHVLLAVLDGHAGEGAAQYVSQQLLDFILQTKQFQQYLRSDKVARTLDAAVDILSAALVQAYVDIDAAYRVYPQGDTSGSTAVCALITPSHILCANVGDSRCVVGTTDGKVIAMSEDHKPTIKEENARIENAGGFVMVGRVNGELAMSRAIGDYQYKQNAKLGPADQMVSCYPDIAVHRRGPTDDLLVLACDGVWDVMTNVEAISFLQESLLDDDNDDTGAAAARKVKKRKDELSKRKDDLTAFEYAEALVEAAFAEGSTDNISAVVMKLSKQTRREIVGEQEDEEEEEEEEEVGEEDSSEEEAPVVPVAKGKGKGLGGKSKGQGVGGKRTKA